MVKFLCRLSTNHTSKSTDLKRDKTEPLAYSKLPLLPMPSRAEIVVRLQELGVPQDVCRSILSELVSDRDQQDFGEAIFATGGNGMILDTIQTLLPSSDIPAKLADYLEVQQHTQQVRTPETDQRLQEEDESQNEDFADNQEFNKASEASQQETDGQ